MGFMDKFKDMVNPEKDFEENYDDYGYEGGEFAQPEQPAANQTFGSASTGTALELKVIRPERFESVTQIADHLINSRTVVLNLEALGVNQSAGLEENFTAGKLAFKKESLTLQGIAFTVNDVDSNCRSGDVDVGISSTVLNRGILILIAGFFDDVFGEPRIGHHVNCSENEGEND